MGGKGYRMRANLHAIFAKQYDRRSESSDVVALEHAGEKLDSASAFMLALHSPVLSTLIELLDDHKRSIPVRARAR